MIFVVILMLLWLLPTLVFVGAAMLAIPGSLARQGATVVPSGGLATAGGLAAAGDVGR